MPYRLTRPGSRAVRPAPAWSVTLAVWAVAATSLFVHADILHLTNGGSVEGEIIEQNAKSYTVRTVVGTITVPTDAVARIEKKPSIVGEYQQRRKDTKDTAPAQVELAKWCENQDLKGPARRHWRRAIELDPDCPPARAALGFVRVGGVWVEGRTVAERPDDGEDTPAKDDHAAADRDDEKVVEAIQTRWSMQIRAIKRNMLESSVERLQREGRGKILAIGDPLAVLPLTRALSKGSWACRDALVDSLSRFPQDEATMNLAVLALIDPDGDIRRRALVTLKRRDDPRVIPQFRRALSSDSDPLISRAAIALGTLEATSAVPDLIDALKVQRRKLVEVPVRRYFAGYLTVFNSPTVIALGQFSQVRHVPMIGIESLGPTFVVVDTEFQERDVTVFRTEVLEALKGITGENFGFDRAAWRRWYREQQP